MKIPVLLSDWTIGFGGARLCFVNILERLDPNAFEIHALVRDRSYLQLKLPGVRFHHFPYLLQYELQSRLRAATRLPSKVCTLLSLPLHSLLYALPYLLFSGWLLLRHRIKVIHLNNWCIFNVPLMVAAKAAGIPVLSHQREHADLRFVWKHRVSDRLLHRHLAVSASVKRSLVKARIPEERILLFYDAIDPEQVQARAKEAIAPPPALDSDCLSVGIFGRIVEWKGQFEAIRAMEIAAARNPRLKLFIVGDASDVSNAYMLQCKAYVEETGLGDRVIFTGYLPNPYPLMARMDIVLHCSISPEPFGMVLVEGMALGKIVVAADLGGPAEILKHGEDGFLVNSRDPSAIAEALVSIAASPQDSQSMGAAARRSVAERFSLDSQLRRLEALYRACAAKAPAETASPGA